MKGDTSIPPLRDLPPGRLAQRRAHLISEITCEGNAPPARAAAERQLGRAIEPTGRSRRNHALLLAATLPIAATVALFIISPWEHSPAFLERAHAALAPPAGSVLHYRYEETRHRRRCHRSRRRSPRSAPRSGPTTSRTSSVTFARPPNKARRDRSCSSDRDRSQRAGERSAHPPARGRAPAQRRATGERRRRDRGGAGRRLRLWRRG